MLRKVRCRTHSRTDDSNLVRLPLLIGSLKQRTIASFLNESHNCAEIFPYEYRSSIAHCQQKPSLIAIDIDDNEFLQEQALIQHRKQSTKFRSRVNGSKLNHHRSLIKLANSESTLATSSHRSDPCKKQTSDSIIFHHRRKPTTNSSHNSNSYTDDSSISDTTKDIPSSDSDVFTPISRMKDKTWRLKIHDDLNKDGSRHSVMHKGSEESIRKRRQNKRAKRSAEKKRRIEERVLKANERWQKYSSIDYELVLFISRYYDQLPLCSNCQNYFVTHQTQFLTEDPRASLDYAADAVLSSPNNKTMTMKQAAKARLIQDYDKQSDILFNLCDTCLKKCEQIRNELKEINFARKISHESHASIINMMTLPTPEVQQQEQSFLSPSPNISDMHDYPFSPTISSPIPPSPLNTNVAQQQQMTSTPPQNTVTDLNQIYMNNLIQNHQIRLQQLYQQSQSIIVAQQYQQHYPFANNQPQLHNELQSCIKQMQYHCLEILHMQYPGYSLSFPYTPSSNPEHLSYRYQQSDDESTDSENSSSPSEEDSTLDEDRRSPIECDENQHSMDDRLTIETCHGLVEYYNAPLDDFIRGLQVLKCLSHFNRFSA